MSLPRIRLLTVAGAVFALAASLLVTTPAVSSESTESTNGDGNRPLAVSQELLDSSDAFDEVAPIDEPANVLLTRISIGPGNPVEGARVTLHGADGTVLARGQSGANGQAMLFADSELPRVVEVRVSGGEASILRDDQIKMRAWHNTGRFDIVHVNPYSTLESACALEASRPRCEASVRRFFGLPAGPDYSYEADFSSAGLRGFDTNMFALEIRNRDVTVWKHSRDMAEEVLAGERYEFEREPASRLVDASATNASDAVIGPQAAPLAGILLAGFAKAVGSGAAQRVGGLLADKLLIGMGFMSPPDKDNSATREDIEQLRRDLGEIKESLVRVETQLSAVRDDIARLADVARQSDYANQRTAFIQQGAALERIARYFEYMLEYSECAQSSPDADRCARRTPPTSPRSGVGLELCNRSSEADTRWARGLLAQCAYVMNSIADYTERYELNSGTNVLAGSANVAGLINTSQWAHISFRSNNLVTSGNQRAIKNIGAFWMNLWSYDTLIWWMAGEEPRLLPVNVEPLDVLDHAEATRQRVQVASTDTTGEFFGRDLPVDCGVNFVVDAATGIPHAIAGLSNPLGSGLTVGNLCDGSRNWHGVDPARGQALGRVAGYLASATGVSSAYVGSDRHGGADGRCFTINLRGIQISEGELAACLRMSLSTTPAVTDLVCTGVTNRGWVRGFQPGRWGPVRWQMPVQFCSQPFPLPQKFQGKRCIAGDPPFRCRAWADVAGAITDIRGNSYGAPDNPTLLSALPFDWMNVPQLAKGRKLQSSVSSQFLAVRPLQPGEVYLPRL